MLWHTEDKHLSERKALYTAEGREYYDGNLLVPDDREIIPCKRAVYAAFVYTGFMYGGFIYGGLQSYVKR